MLVERSLCCEVLGPDHTPDWYQYLTSHMLGARCASWLCCLEHHDWTFLWHSLPLCQTSKMLFQEPRFFLRDGPFWTPDSFIYSTEGSADCSLCKFLEESLPKLFLGIIELTNRVNPRTFVLVGLGTSLVVSQLPTEDRTPPSGWG